MAYTEPMSDEEIEALRREMAEQRFDILDWLERKGVDTSNWDTHPND